MFQLDSRYGVVSPQQLQQLESRLLTPLPNDYKRFLLKWNGGKPNLDRFVVPGWPNQATVVNRFFAVHTGKYSNLEKEIRDYRDRLPQGIIPIAEDPFGNLICLGLENEQRGSVYFWDHEEELDGEGLSRNDYSNMYRLTDGIELFINTLMPH